MKKLLNNKGHSLIELIVSFTVITILLTALFMICSVTYSAIETNRHDTYADILIDNISDYIKNTTGKTCDDLLIYDLLVPGDVSFALVDGARCYALALIDGRLYDFGDMSGETSWLGFKSRVNIDDYRAFNEEYYNNTKVVMGIKRNNDSTRWAALTLCAHREGNKITRSRTINFSMLNEGTEILIYDDDPADDHAGLAEDEAIVDGSGNIIETNILFVYYKLPIESI